MPFLLDHTSPNGTNYPDSYWLIRYYSANDPEKTGQVHFYGYATVEDFDAGNPEIGTRPYTVTDPAIYDQYFGQAHVPTVNAFLSIIELIGMNTPTVGGGFFASAIQLSSVRPVSLEIGAQTTSRVVVVFTAIVDKQVLGNFTSGVTIKVNGVAATITSGTQPGAPEEIVYELSAAVDQNDVVTWEYDSSNGFLEDDSGMTLQTFTPLAITNNAGRYLWFNRLDNSAHIITIGL